MINAEFSADVQPSQQREYADILCRLLDEYVTRLRANVEKFEVARLRFELICSVGSGALGTIFLETLYVQTNQYGIRDFFANSMSRGGFVGDVLGIALAVFIIRLVHDYILKRKLQTFDISSNMEQVAKLIRYSSQVQEVGITDFATRLELDFKTTDAEETLKLAQSAVKVPKQRLSVQKDSPLPEPKLLWEQSIGKTTPK